MEEAAAPAAVESMDLGLSEEEALLQQALAMSMNENEPSANGAEAQDNSMVTDEDAEMQMALQMSMQTDEKKGEAKQQFQDPQFVNQLLGSLPGVDPNDPEIQNALQSMKKDDKKDEGDKKKDGNDEAKKD
jgi:26S proteasome regulatory subunit N10